MQPVRDTLEPSGTTGDPEMTTPTTDLGRSDGSPTRTRTAAVLDRLDRLRSANATLVFLLSLFCGLVVSSIVIVLSTPNLRIEWAGFGNHPGGTLQYTFSFLGRAYGALLKGAVAKPSSFRIAFSDPSAANWAQAFVPLGNTIVASVPLVITALGLSVAYRSGAFNMGGQSQLIMGAVAASWVGFSLPGLPLVPHIVLALLAAAAAGGLTGLIPGALKAFTGASEVIVTIMLNYIAANFLTYLLTSTFFQIQGQGNNPVGKLTLPSATLGPVFGADLPINAGVFIAIATVIFVALLLNRSRLGFEFQIAGASKRAARVAGIRQAWVYLGAFCVSGAIVGIAGGVQVLGVAHQLQTGFGADIGYLAILVAFVGANKPIGVALAGLLYGALQTGGLTMQFSAGISYQLTNVIQALIVMFVTAPALIAGLFRLRDSGRLSRRTRISHVGEGATA